MGLSSLPEEIQVIIFLKLPVNSIYTCRRVCKDWYSLFSSPNFTKSHIDHGIRNPKLMFTSVGFKNTSSMFRSIDYVIEDKSISSTTCTYDAAIPVDYFIRHLLSYSADFQMLGSCNGLICMALYKFEDMCIWNPSTGDYKKMQFPYPDSLWMYPISTLRCEFGFCYDCIANDYKLVRIPDREGFGQVDVYTLGSKSLKTIQSTNHYKFCVSRFNTVFFLNGAFHWIGFSTNKEVCSRVIVSFDVSSERFVDFLIPKEAQMSSSRRIFDSVGVLEDCLSFVSNDKRTKLIDVWLMQDYGVRDSCAKRFSISTTNVRINDLKLLWSFANGELLIETDFGKLLYDPKNETLKVFKIQGMEDGDMRYSAPLNYVESFVSPNSVGSGA